MRLKTLALTSVLMAFASGAFAANAPAPTAPATGKTTEITADGHKQTCKIIKGKKKCHKSPFKQKKATK